MDWRFEARKKKLLLDARIHREVDQGVMERLALYLVPYLTSLWRREQKEHLETYLRGLISRLERKNVESIAYLHDQERKGLQVFIGQSMWEHDPMLRELNQQVGRELGEEDGVIVFDPSAFEKDGRDSVGVQRQWCGRLGKLENCQVGVFMAYVSRKGQALSDVRLYLPGEWTRDRARRKKCGVPRGIGFRTRHDLALEMLKERRQYLPHRWVTGDDEMGRSSGFRGDLRDLEERYLLSVPSNTLILELEADEMAVQDREGGSTGRLIQVRRWIETLDASEWTMVNVRDGEKGPLEIQILKRRVQARTEGAKVGPEELLVVTRTKEGDGVRTDYHLSNAPIQTPLEELAWASKARHGIEDCFKIAKTEVGLKDYEVRTWAGWYHHQTLSLLAAWFLTLEARRGEKIHTSDHSSVGARVDCECVA